MLSRLRAHASHLSVPVDARTMDAHALQFPDASIRAKRLRAGWDHKYLLPSAAHLPSLRMQMIWPTLVGGGAWIQSSSAFDLPIGFSIE